MSWYFYGLSMLVSFVAVGLKGFQHKNVIHNKYLATWVTSMLMASFDVVAISLIVKGDWYVALSSGLGASFGMITAMRFHDYLFKEVEPHEPK